LRCGFVKRWEPSLSGIKEEDDDENEDDSAAGLRHSRDSLFMSQCMRENGTGLPIKLWNESAALTELFRPVKGLTASNKMSILIFLLDRFPRESMVTVES
jgi:hypothetical protein